MKTPFKFFILLFAFAIIFSGCKKEDTTGQVPELTLKVNQFIKDVMNDVYLWYKELPSIDIRYEFDSKAYFKKLLYKNDKWSFITDDVQALENSFQGIEKSYGWSLAFGQFKDSENVFALIEFVYPDTPAERAGFKRGDMIYKINNADISVDNYTDLLYSDNINCTSGQYTDQGIINPETTQMTAEDLQLDPVLFSKIIDDSGHKIGYFLYAQFIGEYNNSLDTVFQHFIDAGVQDVIVDLRYNPGGTTEAAQHLCSALGPASAVDNDDVLVNFQWNDKYQQKWEQKAVLNQLELRFLKTVPVKMGLTKVHFLTGYGTASASEMTITGLNPYMEVTTVGDTTYGKYTASITLKPEDYYSDESYYKDIANWGVQPIILRYKNSQGVTDFVNGFAPDILVDDNLIAGIPLGDKQEPLLKAAIEDITGNEILARKRATIKPYKIFDRGFSRFDANKREVLVNQPGVKSILR